LYSDQLLAQSAIDEAFWLALNARSLDHCLAQLRRGSDGGKAEAEANFRLAEALFHAGRRDDALECCRRALPEVANDAAMLHLGAWVFSNCACHDEAAAAYCRLLELCPDWIEGHRHASGALAASGQIDAAILHAMAASDRVPASAEFALHAGSLLLSAERHDEAADYLDRVMALEPDNAHAFYTAAAACRALGQRDAAIALAQRAASLAPGDTRLTTDVAEILLHCDRADDAAELLYGAAADASDPRLFRVLSAIEMVRGRLEAALAAVDRALALAPGAPEYHLHRALLLRQLGDLANAATAIGRAAALDPASPGLKRAQLDLFLAAGLVSEATAVGGDLLHRFPDDKPAAEAMLHLLSRRLDAIDGEYIVLHDGIERPTRSARPPPGWLERLRRQRRVIGAVIIRETRTRFADSRLGYGWALIEPILHITLLSVMFSVLMHGQPPIGTHFFVFYYTGLIRYYGATPWIFPPQGGGAIAT
jgi:tetratricopeptide (TPR) repeat protein